jgi:hypothetical protein
MFSRPLAFLLLALGCVTAAAGGAYVATRHNASEAVSSASAAPPVAATPAPLATAAQPAPGPVAETEAAVSGAASQPPAGVTAEKADAPTTTGTHRTTAPQKPVTVTSKASSTAAKAPAAPRTVPAAPIVAAAPASQPQPEAQTPPLQAAPSLPEPSKAAEPQPEPARVPQFEEVILPASSVIGLQLETSISSERARVEDRVDARVSRDVMAAGRVAIPAGARVVGTVIEVDKGGKVKAPAHIGIRFHTLVLADGAQVALRTNPIYRDGESPSASSAKKIGGGAVAGMILGGILGGGKGAAIGGATGAAGGTAAVMAGDRTAVNMPSGSFVNATLSSPATITVERREQ